MQSVFIQCCTFSFHLKFVSWSFSLELWRSLLLCVAFRLLFQWNTLCGWFVKLWGCALYPCSYSLLKLTLKGAFKNVMTSVLICVSFVFPLLRGDVMELLLSFCSIFGSLDEISEFQALFTSCRAEGKYYIFLLNERMEDSSVWCN